MNTSTENIYKELYIYGGNENRVFKFFQLSILGDFFIIILWILITFWAFILLFVLDWNIYYKLTAIFKNFVLYVHFVFYLEM